jgi:hypothetical protein
MSVPSVPIVLDKEYRLRFGQSDLIAIEEKLGSVFTLFSPEKMGFSTARVLVWRGLYNETEKGDLVHMFPMTPAGLEQAGEFVLTYVQTKGTFLELFDQMAPGLGMAIGTKKVDPKNPEQSPS